MFSISKAILIKEFDFKDNDKILHFLKSDNNKITIFAPGVRKINSKNSRNIFIGHNSEIEYFFSPDKMSRLKKITLDQEVNLNNWSISYICDYIFKKQDLITFDFYKFIIYLNKLKHQEIIFLSFLIIIFDSGTPFYLSGCISCKKPNNIMEFSFKRQGLICYSCNKYNKVFFDKKESMFLYNIFSYNQKINFKQILGNIKVNKDKNIEILRFSQEHFKSYFFNIKELIELFLQNHQLDDNDKS